MNDNNNSNNESKKSSGRINFGALIGGIAIILSAISIAFNLSIWSYIGQYFGPIILSIVGVWLIVKSVKK